MNAPSRAVVLQHVACEPVGHYAELLDERNWRLEVVRVDQEEPPALDGVDLVIAMGGPMGLQDLDMHPWLRQELDFIRGVLEADIPYWGVCLGAQLLAVALGGAVRKLPEPEFGCFPVFCHVAATLDPVFRAFHARELPAFHWHEDACDLPPCVTTLGSSERCSEQAFVWRNAYGLQFHLEVDRELAASWLDLPAYRQALARTGRSERSVLAELEEWQSRLQRTAEILFAEFLEHIRARREAA